MKRLPKIWSRAAVPYRDERILFNIYKAPGKLLLPLRSSVIITSRRLSIHLFSIINQQKRPSGHRTPTVSSNRYLSVWGAQNLLQTRKPKEEPAPPSSLSRSFCGRSWLSLDRKSRLPPICYLEIALLWLPVYCLKTVLEKEQRNIFLNHFLSFHKAKVQRPTLQVLRLDKFRFLTF